jgi:UDP-2,3-diacylglucosamine pyrophosphatase LpxH
MFPSTPKFKHLLAHVLGLDIARPSFLARVLSPVRAGLSRMSWVCANVFGTIRRVGRRRFRRPEPALTTNAALVKRPDRADTTRLRAIFLSDLHLGARTAQPARVLDFLRKHDAETIYLVGDIIDGWQLRRSWFWPRINDEIVALLLAKLRAGTRLVYLPGNHDEFMRDFYGRIFASVEVVEELVHEGADGKRYLVLHGDKFDVVVAHARWLAFLGDGAYRVTMALNGRVNRVRRAFGLTYWSLSAWAKRKVKNAVNYLGSFEMLLAAEARRTGADGVVCGHIHHAVIRDMDGVTYMNCGDWVESCTALVEHADGRFEIIAWDAHARAEAEAATKDASEALRRAKAAA